MDEMPANSTRRPQMDWTLAIPAKTQKKVAAPPRKPVDPSTPGTKQHRKTRITKRNTPRAARMRRILGDDLKRQWLSMVDIRPCE